MRKSLVGTIAIAAAIICLGLSGVGRATQSLHILWNRSNLSELRALNKVEVAKIVDATLVNGLKPREIAQFKFVDLEGNGKYELLITNPEPCVSWLIIFWQNDSGKIVHVQNLYYAPNLDNSIRDLNGDGRDEIIVPRELVAYDCVRTYTWPAVYRLHGWKYVEASSQFPRYYQTQVIPALKERISKLKKEVTSGPNVPLDVAVMEKDKIMRVLGWNRTAGVQDAYQWMYSDNLELATNAVATLKDIGGHGNALREAEANYNRVYCKRFPTTVTCHPPGGGPMK